MFDNAINGINDYKANPDISQCFEYNLRPLYFVEREGKLNI